VGDPAHARRRVAGAAEAVALSLALIVATYTVVFSIGHLVHPAS